MFPGGITQHSQAIVRNHRRGLADDEDPRMRANHESLRGCSAAIECCLAHLAHHCERPSGSLRLPRPSACSHSEHGRTRLRVSVRALRLPCRLPPVTRYDARGVVMSCVLQLTSFMRFWRESGPLSDRHRHKNLAGARILRERESLIFEVEH
jgi:hypothetical protein